MLTDAQFLAYAKQMHLGDAAVKLVQNIRHSQPSRLVGSGKGNVTGRYPSSKVGLTIQAESGKNELVFIHSNEFDPNVLEYWDQPTQIDLVYKSAKGRTVRTPHTPDLLSVRKDGIRFEECKTEQELATLAIMQPNRYVYENGVWRCPPGEATAAAYGLEYVIRSSDQINWVLESNFLFLQDYFELPADVVSQEVRKKIGAFFAQHAFAPLSDLLELGAPITVDDIYTLISQHQISSDILVTKITEQDAFRVYRDQTAMAAYQALVDASNEHNHIKVPHLSMAAGASFQWDSRTWSILNVGQEKIAIIDEDQTYNEITLSVFERLVKRGSIVGIGIPDDSPVEEALRQAGKEDMKLALRRLKAVEALQADPGAELKDFSRSMGFRLLSAWRSAEQTYGNGLLGLFPKTKQRGNRTAKLPNEVQEVIQEGLKLYGSPEHRTIAATYSVVKALCEAKGYIPPSPETFRQAVHSQDKIKQLKAREGRKAAYQKEPFYWYLEQTTPRHGSRPFERAHIDHTKIDLSSIDTDTSVNLGRAWLTLIIDAHTRRCLGFFLTFDPPSYRSVMMVLRDCVYRYGRLPQTIIVDNGPEFESVYFETFLALHRITKESRPPASPRFGSVCERLFGTTSSQLLHNLLGNTKLMKEPRMVSKSMNPKNLAVWTLPLQDFLLEEYLFETYDTCPHPALTISPRDAFIQGMAAAGDRRHKIIPYTKAFIISTYPSTSKGTVTISSQRGVTIRGIPYYTEEFRDWKWDGKSVPVRYDPFNAGVALVYLHDHWARCISYNYAIFNNRSEKEIQIASAALRQRKTIHGRMQRDVGASRLGNLLLTAKGIEEDLKLQRMKDKELKSCDHFARLNLADSDKPTAAASSARDESAHAQEAAATEAAGAQENASSKVNDEDLTGYVPEILPDF